MVLVITSSGIPLSQIFVSKVICIQKSVYYEEVSILVTSESSWSITDESFDFYTENKSRFLAFQLYILIKVEYMILLKIKNNAQPIYNY